MFIKLLTPEISFGTCSEAVVVIHIIFAFCVEACLPFLYLTLPFSELKSSIL